MQLIRCQAERNKACWNHRLWISVQLVMQWTWKCWVSCRSWWSHSLGVFFLKGNLHLQAKDISKIWEQCLEIIVKLPINESWIQKRSDRNTRSEWLYNQRQVRKTCSMGQAVKDNNDFPTSGSSGSSFYSTDPHSSVWRKDNKAMWYKSMDRRACHVSFNFVKCHFQFTQFISLVQT